MHVCGVIPASVCHISAQCRIADTEAYRHKLVSFSIPQSLHYIKKAQGCAEGRGLVPLCGFLTFQCDLPSAGFRSPCAIQPKAAAYAAYTADVPQSMRHIRPGFRNPCDHSAGASAAHAVIRPEFRNPCGHSAGASAAHAVIISPYKI